MKYCFSFTILAGGRSSPAFLCNNSDSAGQGTNVRVLPVAPCVFPKSHRVGLLTQSATVWHTWARTILTTCSYVAYSTGGLWQCWVSVPTQALYPCPIANLPQCRVTWVNGHKVFGELNEGIPTISAHCPTLRQQDLLFVPWYQIVSGGVWGTPQPSAESEG